MYIPNYVNQCLEALEAAGFAAYAVGGCVRDACLGLTPHDYDLCTSALPEQTETVFSGFSLVLAGKKHGTVGVITEGGVVEITTFRTEGEYRDSRHPEWVEFVSDIEKDLARRDFTVNAMAYSPTRGFADPFGGQEDLKNGILRAVGEPELRFTEDALRIARGVRFAVRFHLTPEKETEEAMLRLAPRLKKIAAERVFDELCKLLPLMKEGDLLRFAPILGEIIPELKPTFGYDQRNPHHAYDLYTHIAQVTAAVPPELPLRWAALLHDIGKPATSSIDEKGIAHYHGHAQVSAEMAAEVLRRLKAPTQLREQVVALIDQHMTYPIPDKKWLRRRLSRLGEELLTQLLVLQQADTGSKGTANEGDWDYFRQIHNILAEILAENACLQIRDLAVNGHDLMSLGIQGRAIGQTLNCLLEAVIDEQLPNEKTALLAAVNHLQLEEMI